MSFKKNKKFTGIVFGVVPEWQGKGVDAYIIAEAAKHVQSDACPYTEYEMQWIGDFNPKMVNVASTIGNVKVSRKYKIEKSIKTNSYILNEKIYEFNN